MKNDIFNMLLAQGCEITEAEGIVYVKKPNGEVWDFTVPMKNEEMSK